MLMIAGRERSRQISQMSRMIGASLGVERGGRLVDEEELGVLLEPRGRFPRAGAGRRKGRPARLSTWSVRGDALQQAEGLVDVGLGKATQEGAPRTARRPSLPESTFLHDGEAFDERVFLEDHADAPAHGGAASLLPTRLISRFAEWKTLAAGRLHHRTVDAADHAFDLPAPEGPIEPDDLARGHLEGDVGQGLVPGLVALGQALDAQHAALSR